MKQSVHSNNVFKSFGLNCPKLSATFKVEPSSDNWGKAESFKPSVAGKALTVAVVPAIISAGGWTFEMHPSSRSSEADFPYLITGFGVLLLFLVSTCSENSSGSYNSSESFLRRSLTLGLPPSLSWLFFLGELTNSFLSGTLIRQTFTRLIFRGFLSSPFVSSSGLTSRPLVSFLNLRRDSDFVRRLLR